MKYNFFLLFLFYVCHIIYLFSFFKLFFHYHILTFITFTTYLLHLSNSLPYFNSIQEYYFHFQKNSFYILGCILSYLGRIYILNFQFVSSRIIVGIPLVKKFEWFNMTTTFLIFDKNMSYKYIIIHFIFFFFLEGRRTKMSWKKEIKNIGFYDYYFFTLLNNIDFNLN